MKWNYVIITNTYTSLAVALAQRADAVAASGQDLVRIGLVADVPNQPVSRRIENVMQRDSELDHAEAGAEMAAGRRDGVDGLNAQFVSDLPQLSGLKVSEIVRVLMWSSNGVFDETVTLRSFKLSDVFGF